jgi:hypothetical protein
VSWRTGVALLVATLLAGCGDARPGTGAPVPSAVESVSPSPSKSPDTELPLDRPPIEVEPPAPAVPGCDEDVGVAAGTPTWLVRLVTPGPDYSVVADGTVVEVATTDIYASVDDYLTWTISEAAIQRVAAALSDREAMSTPLPAAEGSFVDVSDPCQGPVGNDWTLGAVKVLATITDPDLQVTDPRPWQPDDLWLIVHPADQLGSPNAPSDGFAPWPLPGTIGDHVVGHDVYRADSEDAVPVRWACLRGENVAPVWELQQPGTRNTWIRLEDAEGRWEVTIRPSWPGYRLSSDPCGDVG